MNSLGGATVLFAAYTAFLTNVYAFRRFLKECIFVLGQARVVAVVVVT